MRVFRLRPTTRLPLASTNPPPFRKGRNYATSPVNANEAEARRFARFWSHGHTPGRMEVQAEPLNPSYPCTLDLRWRPF
jgi:uncharacterized protein (DUF2126 family)